MLKLAEPSDIEPTKIFSEGYESAFDVVETSSMADPAFSVHLGPDELQKLAASKFAEARRMGTGPERLTTLMIADALMNLAAIKKLLLEYERRQLN